METQIMDAKQINELINEIIKEKNIQTDKKVIILTATNDEAAKRYGKVKQKALEKINIKSEVLEISEDLPQDLLIKYIHVAINQNEEVGGCIIQLPLYKHLDPDLVVNALDPFKDIDCLTYLRQGSLYTVNNKDRGLVPCTAAGVEMILTQYVGGKKELSGKNAVIIGRGPLVADPLSKMLELKDMTVTKVHSKTNFKYMSQLINNADIIVSCVGKDMSHLLNPMNVKKDAVLIGVGFRYENGKQKQDFNVEDFIKYNKLFYGKVTSDTNATGLATIANFKYNVISLLEK